MLSLYSTFIVCLHLLFSSFFTFYLHLPSFIFQLPSSVFRLQSAAFHLLSSSNVFILCLQLLSSTFVLNFCIDLPSSVFIPLHIVSSPSILHLPSQCFVLIFLCNNSSSIFILHHRLPSLSPSSVFIFYPPSSVFYLLSSSIWILCLCLWSWSSVFIYHSYCLHNSSSIFIIHLPSFSSLFIFCLLLPSHRWWCGCLQYLIYLSMRNFQFWFLLLLQSSSNFSSWLHIYVICITRQISSEPTSFAQQQ